MKKILYLSASLAVLAGSQAFAADMALKAPMAPPSPAWSWTGFYLGGDVGGEWARDSVSPTVADGGVFPRTNRFNTSGVVGGGTVGYNYQLGTWLIGIEGDLGGMGISRTAIDPGAAGETDHIGSGLYGDVTGRLGVVFGSALLYAKGGYAFYDGQGNTTTTAAGYTSNSTGTFDGWTLGGGLEYMFAPGWSAKVEYQHFDFGHENASLVAGAGAAPVVAGTVYPYRNYLTADTVKVGIDYHFGGGSMMGSRY